MGNNFLTPGRLAQHESELVALQVRGGDVMGSFDQTRMFRSPGGAQEVDLEQDLLGTVRFLRQGQASLLVPLVETWRSFSTASQFGGGLGDVALSGRWDFTLAGRDDHIPGIAALIGATIPTGRPPESATPPLGADATGTGSWLAGAGLALEQSWTHAFVTLTGLVSQNAPRHVLGISETLGTQFSVGAALGWAFLSGPAVGLTATYVASTDAVVNGIRATGSARAVTSVGVGASKPIGEDWRVVGSLNGSLPISGTGQNEPVVWGLSALVIRGWM